jgi:hypothetical protein
MNEQQMNHTKYNWERLNGYVEYEQWNVQIDQRRRKADADKLSAKGKGKGAKIARCQSIADAMPEQFMNIAKRANRTEKQREERRAKRAK